MQFNHGEFPSDVPEELEEEGLDLEIIIELEPVLGPEGIVVEKPPECVPQDEYLQKELERQRQEELEKMLPKRIP